LAYQGIKNGSGPAVAVLMKKHGYSVSSEDPIQIEKEFYYGILRFAEGLLSKDPLSDASLIGFIALDRAIHRNVNILLKMKSHGFSREKIKGVLSL